MHSHDDLKPVQKKNDVNPDTSFVPIKITSRASSSVAPHDVEIVPHVSIAPVGKLSPVPSDASSLPDRSNP